ncbi:MAG: hypothetical protein ACK5O2_03720, partial [Microthrixaceae bacterium]
DVQIAGDVATVTVHATLEGRPVTLVHTLTAADPTITTHTTLRARARRTVTLVARHTARSESVSMHQPGAMVTRPLRRWYDPTFWPLHTFASLSSLPDVNHHPGTGEGRHLAVATATPTGLHVEPDGTTEVVVARTAIKEVAFGVVPVMAPAWGRRWGTQRATVGFAWAPAGDPATSTNMGRHLARTVDRAAGCPYPSMPVWVEDPDIDITTVKPAQRGEGTIVRLRNWAPQPGGRVVRVSVVPGIDAEITAACLTDSRERDTTPITITGTVAEVPVTGHMTTVRLQTKPG